MARKSEPAEEDWKADFDSVRLQQMLDFRRRSPREKVQAMEDMAEIVEAARHARALAAQRRTDNNTT
jgi:hypothetical protein